MNKLSKSLCLFGVLMLALSAHAQHWLSLSGTDSGTDTTLVDVDLKTVRLLEGSGEAVIRVTYDVLQPHPAGFGYRSFVATASIDCARRAIGLTSAAYFAMPAGQGMRVGTDSAGREKGMPRKIADSVPPHAKQALLKAACQGGPP